MTVTHTSSNVTIHPYQFLESPSLAPSLDLLSVVDAAETNLPDNFSPEFQGGESPNCDLESFFETQEITPKTKVTLVRSQKKVANITNFRDLVTLFSNPMYRVRNPSLQSSDSASEAKPSS